MIKSETFLSILISFEKIQRTVARWGERERPQIRYKSYSMLLNKTLAGQKKPLMKYVDKLDCKKHKYTNGAGTKRRKEDKLIMNFTHQLMNSEVIQNMDSVKWNQ